jgi:hypothetical protein
MMLQFSVLVLYVNKPAVQFLRWHGENLACEFAETVRESIHGEEVGSFSAVN